MNKEKIDGIIDMLLKMKTISKIILKDENEKETLEIGFEEILEVIDSLPLESTNERVILRALDYLKVNKLYNGDSANLLEAIKKVTGRQWISIMIKIFNRRYPIRLDEFYLKDIEEIFIKDLNINLSEFTHFDDVNVAEYIYSYLNMIFSKYHELELHNKYSEHDMAIIAYLWFVLYYRKDVTNFNFNLIKSFEQVFVSYFARIKSNEINDRYTRIVPIALEKKEFRRVFKNFEFLYHDTVINEKKLDNMNVEKSIIIESQKNKIEQLENMRAFINKKNKELNEIVIKKDEEITQLNEQILDLKNELKIEKGKQEFEQNSHENQMESLEKDIIKDLTYDLQLDLENIGNILGYIDDERIKTKIMNRLDNIYDKLKKY